MLIWRMVFDVRFAATSASTSAATTTTTIVTGRCVALSITAILANQPSNLVMSDRRKNFFRWLISVLFCCWNSSTASGSATTCIESSATSAGNNRRVIETIEMGPLSLREYVNTLEPYDPEKHGWRGEEPWGYRERIRRQYHHHHHYHQSVPIAAAAGMSSIVFDDDICSSSADLKKATFNGMRNNCHYFSNLNHIAYNELPV